MTREFGFNNIKSESEKAICLNVSVSWGNGNVHQKDIWFPKSLITIAGSRAMVADWFADKLEKQNAYNGYLMTFAF